MLRYLGVLAGWKDDVWNVSRHMSLVSIHILLFPAFTAHKAMLLISIYEIVISRSRKQLV